MLTVNLIHEININEQLKSFVPSQILNNLGALNFSITAWDEETGAFLGFLIYSSHESILKRTVLDYIYVFEEYRNQKVGTSLVDFFIDNLKPIGIKEIEVNLLDSMGHFEDSLNFFLDRNFFIKSEERAIITYSRDEIIESKLLKDLIQKYNNLSDIKGIRIFSENDSRDNFKLEQSRGYKNLSQVKTEGDFSFYLYDKDEMIVMALCTLEGNNLFYFVYDTGEVKIDKNDLANIFIATGVAIKKNSQIQNVSFAISNEKVFEAFMIACGEREDIICSQRLIYKYN